MGLSFDSRLMRFAVLFVAALVNQQALASGSVLGCQALLETAPKIDGFLDTMLVHPDDANLLDSLQIKPAVAEKLRSKGTLERIEWQGFESFAVLKDSEGRITRYPVTVAPEIADPAKFDIHFSDNSAAFAKRYPRWNEIFKTARNASDGPVFREMRLSVDALKAIARQGLRVEDSRGFTTLYFAGFRVRPTNPKLALKFAFDHSGDYLPVVVELRPAAHGIQVDSAHKYDGPEYFHTTISTDISPDQIDHIWVFDKNAPATESPFKDVKPLLMKSPRP